METKVKYADHLTELDWENIKKSNTKVYQQLQKRKNDTTFDEIIVVFDKFDNFLFFDYMY